MAKKGITYRIVRSDRKTLGIYVTREGEVEVRCPRQATDADVRAQVEAHRDWIEKHLAAKQALPEKLPPFTPEEIRQMADLALKVFPAKTAHFAALLGVTYGRITIRAQRTKWASCSSTGNLNFNCVLMRAPEAVVDYIVVHELCHRKHMDHSAAFWAEVERLVPDYKAHKKWLKDHGEELIGRIG